MYSLNSVKVLESRIKWRTPMGKFATILEAELIASENDKAYQDAHKLITIENIHSTQPKENITNEEFNTYLRRLNKSCVDKVLEDVFDLNNLADSSKNYDELIEKNKTVFDASLRLYMAVQVIQGMITSTRSNRDERLLKSSYPHLKIELEGSKNDNGKTLSVGVNFLYNKSIEKVKKKLFPRPKKVVLQSLNVW